MAKVLHRKENGDTLVECPVCKMPYLEHALNQHLSQMAGKEAQYAMADTVYTMIEDELIGLEVLLEDVLNDCPHWKYLLDHPKTMPDSRPVVQKERWVRDNRIGRVLDKVKGNV